MAWPGFEDARVAVGDADYFLAHGGDGSPVLLLHGFPQTHVCWSAVAPALARHHRVVAADLRGYGDSRAPAGGAHGEGYTNRERAAELVELMAALGHRRFAVVGHDRGARVGYRMALDHPERITGAALLNVVPTLDQFEAMGEAASLAYWPWFLLAQPAPFPEKMLGAAPDALLDNAFCTWTDDPDAVPPDHRAAYLAAFREPDTVAAMCADYRASYHLDREHDAADRGTRRITVPVLLVTGEDESQLDDAPRIWDAWTDDLTATRVPGGHFIPEEAPDALVAALGPFLDRLGGR